MTASLCFGDTQLESPVLEARAARLAGGLHALGLAEGDVVAALLRNGPVYVDLILACRVIGTYYCPLNWHLAPAEVAFVLHDSGARVLIGEADLIAALGSDIPTDITIITSDAAYEAWLAENVPYAGPVALPRGHMAYTSGTTGRPKGIRRLPAPPNAALASVVEKTMGLTRLCRALLSAPLYHSAPSVFAQQALQLCELLVLMPQFAAEQTLSLIERHRVDTVYLVPIMYTRLLTLPAETRARYNLSSLRFIASTGAPCAPEVKRAMIAWLGPIVHETYASSEAGMITAIDAEEALARPGSAGRPVGDATIRIMREDGTPCANSEIGLIYVRQPAYPHFTYNHQPEARAAIERNGHISLGDMGYLDDARYLFVCDRASDMVISGGVNLYPAEIEHSLMQQPGIVDCAVFGIPDSEFGERLHALIQLAPDTRLSQGEVIEQLRGKIAGFKIPRSMEFVDTLPRDANGKIAKRRLRTPYWDAAGRSI